jgi:hypothetical protein
MTTQTFPFLPTGEFAHDSLVGRLDRRETRNRVRSMRIYSYRIEVLNAPQT